MWDIVLLRIKIKTYTGGSYAARRAGMLWLLSPALLVDWWNENYLYFSCSSSKPLTMRPEAALRMRNGEKL